MNRLLKHFALPVLAISLGVGLMVAGCNVLEVDNPNNLIEEDLNNPSASTAMANGTEASVARALGAIFAPYHTATDELTWIGSRDAWSELDIGTVSNALNEFTDAAFPYVAEARWQADEFIGRLEGFKEDGTLPNNTALGRMYLYGAVIYTTIADMFEDFPLGSDRREGAPPVGPSNMSSLYDTALQYVDNGLQLVPEGSEYETALMGLRARIQFSKSVWEKVNPPGQVASDPLVNNAGAVADAQAALEMMSDDFVYELELVASSPDLVVGDLSMALQVNNRAELGFGTTYIDPSSDGTYSPDDENSAVTFTDMITGEVHPHLKETIDQFVAEREYADIPVVSAREMHLILAEAALAGNPNVDFQAQINALRALDDLEPYDGQGDAAFERQLLVQSRQVNLFLQGRRLADHYRFDDPSAEWTGSRDEPGTFFPITITEIRANPNLSQ